MTAAKGQSKTTANALAAKAKGKIKEANARPKWGAGVFKALAPAPNTQLTGGTSQIQVRCAYHYLICVSTVYVHVSLHVCLHVYIIQPPRFASFRTS